MKTIYLQKPYPNSEIDEAIQIGLIQRYKDDPKVKALADKIHESRLLGPPACPDCIRMAIIKMEDE